MQNEKLTARLFSCQQTQRTLTQSTRPGCGLQSKPLHPIPPERAHFILSSNGPEVGKSLRSACQSCADKQPPAAYFDFRTYLGAPLLGAKTVEQTPARLVFPAHEKATRSRSTNRFQGRRDSYNRGNSMTISDHRRPLYIEIEAEFKDDAATTVGIYRGHGAVSFTLISKSAGANRPALPAAQRVNEELYAGTVSAAVTRPDRDYDRERLGTARNCATSRNGHIACWTWTRNPLAALPFPRSARSAKPVTKMVDRGKKMRRSLPAYAAPGIDLTVRLPDSPLQNLRRCRIRSDYHTATRKPKPAYLPLTINQLKYSPPPAFSIFAFHMRSENHSRTRSIPWGYQESVLLMTSMATGLFTPPTQRVMEPQTYPAYSYLWRRAS